MYHRFCPRCGHLNRNLNLEETKGIFECSHCGTLVQLEDFPHPTPWSSPLRPQPCRFQQVLTLRPSHHP